MCVLDTLFTAAAVISPVEPKPVVVADQDAPSVPLLRDALAYPPAIHIETPFVAMALMLTLLEKPLLTAAQVSPRSVLRCMEPASPTLIMVPISSPYPFPAGSPDQPPILITLAIVVIGTPLATLRLFMRKTPAIAVVEHAR